MFLFRPDALFTDFFILHDHGQNLFLVDELAAGRWLYRDVASVYGPVPALVHWAAARLFGNTAATYLHLWQILSVAGAGMLFCLLRRVASRGVTLLWLGIVVFPFFLMPTAARSTLAYTLYPAFERLAALGLALGWRPLAERSRWRTALLGALLGGMQLLKFGIAFPAAVALLATDALTARRKDRWLAGAGILLAGFAIVEAAWAAAVLGLLTPERAGAVLWPAFMLGSYRTYVSVEQTYLGALLSWCDVRWALEIQLPLFVAALLALSGVARWGHRWGRERNVFGLAAVPFRKISHSLPATGTARETGWACLLTIYFSVAVVSIGYAHWVGAQLEWMFAAAALPGGVLLVRSMATLASRILGRPGLAARMATALGLLAFLPSAFAGLAQLRKPAANEEERQPVPFAHAAGEQLWLSSASRAAFAEVGEIVARLASRPHSDGGGPAVLFLPMASGWHHYFGYGLPAGTRHRWIMSGWVPRADEPGILAALADADAVVFTSRGLLENPIGPDPASWPGGHNPGFSDETNAKFRRLLGEPIPVDDRLTIFPVRR